MALGLRWVGRRVGDGEPGVRARGGGARRGLSNVVAYGVLGPSVRTNALHGIAERLARGPVLSRADPARCRADPHGARDGSHARATSGARRPGSPVAAEARVARARSRWPGSRSHDRGTDGL